MKEMILLVLFGAAVALPQNQGQRPQGPFQQKENPMNIIRCMSENFGNETNIKLCRDCFKEDFDFKVQDGLDRASACAIEWWPAGVAECKTEIAAMEPGNWESLKSVLGCFDERLETENKKRCINESQTTDTEEHLIDASVCILDSWKFAFNYVKNNTRRRGGKSQGGRRPGPRGRGMKRMMMRMMTKAHCEISNDGDSTKADACVKCFKDAIPRRQPRRQRGRREASPSVIAALTTCSNTHLSSEYEGCTRLVQNGSDKTAIKECYNKILIGNYVGECISEKDIKTADVNSLGTVVDCGVEKAFEWLGEANPRLAKRFGKMLEKTFGEKDEDEDEDDNDEEE